MGKNSMYLQEAQRGGSHARLARKGLTDAAREGEGWRGQSFQERARQTVCSQPNKDSFLAVIPEKWPLGSVPFWNSSLFRENTWGQEELKTYGSRGHGKGVVSFHTKRMCSRSETDGALTLAASRGRSGTQSGLTAFQLNLPYLTASDQPPQSFGTTSRLKTPQKTLRTPTYTK